MLNLNKGSTFFAFLGVDSHLSWNLKWYFHPVPNILKGILKEREREREKKKKRKEIVFKNMNYD